METLTLDEPRSEVAQRWVAEASRLDAVQTRGQARYPFARPATICNGGFEVRAMCRDLSNRGIGLVQTECPPQIGDHTISIWLRNRVVHLPINILWTQQIGRCWWASGGHLMIGMWDNLRLFVDRYMSQLQDRRSTKRYTFCRSFLVSVEGGFEQDSEFGGDDMANRSMISLDISDGGVRVISDEPFASEGRFLHLHQENEPSEEPARGIVRSVYEMKNGYCSTGVEFCY